MLNLIEKVKIAIVEAMAYRFPKYPVSFENVEGDPYIIGVGVFAVPPSEFVKVQDFIFELESCCTVPEGWELLPLVRDPIATSKHYPEILAKWSVPMLYDIASHIIPTTGYSSLAAYARLSMKDIARSETVRTPSLWECKHEPIQKPKPIDNVFAFAA